MASAARKIAATESAAMETTAVETTPVEAGVHAAAMNASTVKTGAKAAMKGVAVMEAASDAATAPRKVVPVIRIVVITGGCVVAGLVLVVVLNGRIGLGQRWL